jgi:hypothetical protein
MGSTSFGEGGQAETEVGEYSPMPGIVARCK